MSILSQQGNGTNGTDNCGGAGHSPGPTEFEELKQAMADREQEDYERKAGFLQSDEEVPGESSERNRQHRQARQKARYDNMSRSDQAAFDRAARKARRRKELGQDPLPGDEKYSALQEAVLRKLLESM